MKRSKFSDSQIAYILRQAEEGTSVEEVCRKTGISVQTYYRWRKKYGGLMPSEMKRLKQVVEHLKIVWQVSVRRTCRAIKAARSTFYYRPRRAEQAALRKRIREIAETRVRYGYRRIHVLLQREGWEVNAKRVYRLYCEEGLQLRNKTPKRKVSAKRRENPVVANQGNEVWAMVVYGFQGVAALIVEHSGDLVRRYVTVGGGTALLLDPCQAVPDKNPA